MIRISTIVVMLACAAQTEAQSNPLPAAEKVKNYLPHMSWPEVEALARRTDMVIIPVGFLEQHGHQLPIGTDILNGIERAKLVAQRTDVLVAPILLPGNSPYHLGFAGTITLSLETIQAVYVEAARSLLQHGFKRFLILISTGDTCVFRVDRTHRIRENTGVVELA